MNIRHIDGKEYTLQEVEKLAKELCLQRCGGHLDERPAIFARTLQGLVWWHARSCKK